MEIFWKIYRDAATMSAEDFGEKPLPRLNGGEFIGMNYSHPIDVEGGKWANFVEAFTKIKNEYIAGQSPADQGKYSLNTGMSDENFLLQHEALEAFKLDGDPDEEDSF